MTAQRRFVRRTVLAVTASVAALTLAACGSDGKAGSGTATASGTATGAHNAADVSFSKEMIQHHRQAVEMAGLAAGHASSAQAATSGCSTGTTAGAPATDAEAQVASACAMWLPPQSPAS